MSYKTVVFLLIIVISMMVAGCQGESDESEGGEETMGRRPLTRAYLYEKYGITDEDLEGIEFDYFVEEGPLGERGFDKIDSKTYVIDYFKNDQAALEEEWLKIENDKSYLLTSPIYEGEVPAITTLKYLSLEHEVFEETADKRAYFLDFDANKFYYNNTRSMVADLAKVFNNVEELNSEEIEEILKTLEELDIRGWEQNYDKEGRKRYLNWDMGLEFESGEVVTIKGTFNEEGGYPEALDTLIFYFQSLEKSEWD